MARVQLDYESPARRNPTVLRKDLGWIGYAAAGMMLVCFAIAVFPVKYRNRHARAEIAAARYDLETLRGAVERFHLDMGRLPTSAEGLDALVVAPANGANAWHGPYLRKLSCDPWGQPYVYRQPGAAAAFEVVSFGPDQQPGGGDDISD